jgi:hypothetical protein
MELAEAFPEGSAEGRHRNKSWHRFRLISRVTDMVTHMFPNFLEDEQVYREVESYWAHLWEQIDANSRVANGWHQPWFQPLPPSIGQGNPIFSAVSPRLRRGIRIIQAEPTEKELEFVAYPDTFGGPVFDPHAIHELVISCALSDAAAWVAFSLMSRWVEGKGLSFDLSEAGLVPSIDFADERIYAHDLLLPEASMITIHDSTDENIHLTRPLEAA